MMTLKFWGVAASTATSLLASSQVWAHPGNHAHPHHAAQALTDGTLLGATVIAAAVGLGLVIYRRRKA